MRGARSLTLIIAEEEVSESGENACCPQDRFPYHELRVSRCVSLGLESPFDDVHLRTRDNRGIWNADAFMVALARIFFFRHGELRWQKPTVYCSEKGRQSNVGVERQWKSGESAECGVQEGRTG